MPPTPPTQLPPVIFLMGPTASGKTDMAMALRERLPVEIVSVDSALVYRGMDIGTAKPSLQQRAKAPHGLIDIRDPADAYSVADFCRDAESEIESITRAGRIPLLTGGTMMYFRALRDGLATMPAADPSVRRAIEREAERKGWPALHAQLTVIDSDYARQLHPNHSQRICRALEVYRISGKTMSQWRKAQDRERTLSRRYRLIQLGLGYSDRAQLHQRIEKRFLSMLEQGFIHEVKVLRQRGDLHIDLPSMRAVGYRQVWEYLDHTENAGIASAGMVAEADGNNGPCRELLHKGIAATRQLAKRQLTWLKQWPDLRRICVDQREFKQNIELALNFLGRESL